MMEYKQVLREPQNALNILSQGYVKEISRKKNKTTQKMIIN